MFEGSQYATSSISPIFSRRKPETPEEELAALKKNLATAKLNLKRHKKVMKDIMSRKQNGEDPGVSYQALEKVKSNYENEIDNLMIKISALVLKIAAQGTNAQPSTSSVHSAGLIVNARELDRKGADAEQQPHSSGTLTRGHGFS